MRRTVLIAAFVALAGAASAETPVERGKYLATLAGCNDCHTPGGMLGQADEKRRLGGSDVGFGDPASGVWVGGNLTPDKDTGLGRWTTDQIIAALTTGKTPGGRTLSEIMPWPALAHLTSDDAHALAAYLQSLPGEERRARSVQGGRDAERPIRLRGDPNRAILRLAATEISVWRLRRASRRWGRRPDGRGRTLSQHRARGRRRRGGDRRRGDTRLSQKLRRRMTGRRAAPLQE